MGDSGEECLFLRGAYRVDRQPLIEPLKVHDFLYQKLTRHCRVAMVSAVRTFLGSVLHILPSQRVVKLAKLVTLELFPTEQSHNNSYTAVMLLLFSVTFSILIASNMMECISPCNGSRRQAEQINETDVLLSVPRLIRQSHLQQLVALVVK